MDEQLKEIMAAVLEIEESEITDSTSPQTVESWDSLRQMNLIAAIEEEFEVNFSQEQMMQMLNYQLIKITLEEVLG